MTIKKLSLLSYLAFFFALPSQAVHFHGETEVDPGRDLRYVEIEATNRDQRTKLLDLGVSIEAVRSDRVWGFANTEILNAVHKAGFTVKGDYDVSLSRGGHQSSFDFPRGDERFHNYSEMKSVLMALESQNPNLFKVFSIGKSVENRDILAARISATPLKNSKLGKNNLPPATVFMGMHHAREHLSAEMPIMLAQYLMAKKNDPKIAALIKEREIWIIPMVNPDGGEYDIESGSYRMWRKNRRNNGDRTFGVDLNRNYGYKWGTGGSSSNSSSDIYRGPSAFSEPETQTIKKFIEARPNLTTLLSFHTYSELVLYPWGYTYDSIQNPKDLKIFETMANTMAGWNKYTPQQSSDLYITSGDTTDWAYGERGIYAFTFELSPKSGGFGGRSGFYPGAGIIDRVFNDNLNPMLYLIDVTDNPEKVLSQRRMDTYLTTIREPISEYLPK